VVQAYKKDRDVSILSTPQILTTDNQEARIYVGKNLPFQTTATATATGNEVYNSFEYRDVGKTLKITPQISKDRRVKLEISLEVTALESTTDFRPTTLKRTIDTTAIVNDGNTVVLGGLIDSDTANVYYKTPCLGDIPGLGMLFRSTARGGSKTNLYVFLTPHVIQNEEEAKYLSGQKREEIDTLREELIKLYENKPAPSDVPPQTVPKEKKSSIDQGPSSSDANQAMSTQAQPAGSIGPSEPVAAGSTAQAEKGASRSAPPEGYTIQVASVQSYQEAEDILKSLTDNGYAAYTVRTDTQGEVWYNLRIGFFSLLEAAQETMDRLRNENFNPTLIKL
jgi:general secretion pathway protein D